MKDQDSVFFKNFSIMLGVLVLLTIILAVLSYVMHYHLLDSDDNEPNRTNIVESIKSTAQVNTGDVIVSQAVTEVVAVANEPASTEEMYQSACFSCHGTGAAGSPKLDEPAAWVDRLPQGLDALTASAIKGIGIMPPKGGRADLSDATIRELVEFMIKD
ncbi:MAG: c-type cytochrome, partial [Proteobacteria bacterium]|nr:c-type cytochrome [Pseudomonadota bacterium]